MWCDEGPTTNALANGTFNQMNRIIQLHNRRARRSTADTHNSWLLLTIINSCARGYLQILISPHDLPPRTRLLLLADWLYLVPWPILVDYRPSCLKADLWVMLRKLISCPYTHPVPSLFEEWSHAISHLFRSLSISSPKQTRTDF